MAKPAKKSGAKKTKRNVPNGVAHIQSTFNNTIVSITDTAGEVISWSSAGASGFKGARKGTPFAAQTSHLQGADRGFTTGTGAADQHLDLAHALLQGTASSGLGSGLCSEGSSLPSTLETTGSGGTPGDHFTGGVGDGNNGVVERALDVRNTVGHIALRFFGAGFLGGLGHRKSPAEAGR